LHQIGPTAFLQIEATKSEAGMVFNFMRDDNCGLWRLWFAVFR